MTRVTTPGLRELQRWFASVTTHPEGVLQNQASSARRKKLERLVTPGPQLSALERTRIYHDGYFSRLIECLADDYPALRHALGESVFDVLARAYIVAYPSRSRSLNAFGAHLPAYCRTRTEPWAPFAADLARLEWALVEVVHEPSTEGLAAGALAQIPPGRWQTARLRPAPSVRVLCFDYPVNEFFQAFRDERSPQLPLAARSATAVYRRGLSLWRMSLDPRAALLLTDLLASVPLGAAIEALQSRSEAIGSSQDLPQLLSRWLGEWVQNGFFAAVELG